MKSAPRATASAAPWCARLPPSLLARAFAAGQPLVLIVPDVRRRVAPPDLALSVRRQLGMEEGKA